MIRYYKNRLGPRARDKRAAVVSDQSSVISDGNGKRKTKARKLEAFTAPPHQRAVT